MMDEPRVFYGVNLDEALTAACNALHARVGELHYEIITDDERTGVEITAELDPVAVLGLFLSETFNAGKIEVTARLRNTAEALEGELSGQDLGIFMASGGRGLDALQYLCNRVMNRRMNAHHPVHLDGDGFKERRSQQLQRKAENAADEAIRRRGAVRLGPLTPAARREIHLALANDPDVETESDGEGFLKRVVVRPRRRH